MVFAEYTQHGSSQTPPGESWNQVYKYICETLSNTEMIDTSTAPHVSQIHRSRHSILGYHLQGFRIGRTQDSIRSYNDP